MSNDAPIYKCESEIAGLSLVTLYLPFMKDWWFLTELSTYQTGKYPREVLPYMSYTRMCHWIRTEHGTSADGTVLGMTPHPLPLPQGNNTVRSFSSYFAVTFASSHPILQLKTGFMPGLTRLTIKMNFSKKDVSQNLPRHGRKKNSRSKRHRKIRYETETT